MVPKIAVAAEAGIRAPAATRCVVFKCADRRFGVPLESVTEITAPRPFTRLPGAGPAVCGLVGIRGTVVTVLDLGVLLAGAASGALPDHRLLLLEVDGRRIGAAVDQVVEIVSTPLQPGGPVAAAEDRAGDAAVGTGHGGSGEFIALDAARLLKPMLQI